MDVTLRDHAFTVTGGTVTKTRRLEARKNVRWEITVDPSGDARERVPPRTTEGGQSGRHLHGQRGRPELTFTVPGKSTEQFTH